MLAFYCYLFLANCLFTSVLSASDASCNQGMGLDFNLPTKDKLPDDRITASSEQRYWKAIYGRLRHPVRPKIFGVWCPETQDKRPWFQVDFMIMRSVTSVAMGCTEYSHGYVTEFSLSYSYDGKVWYQVKDKKTNKTKRFQGLEDKWTPNKVDLDEPVTAQYFRIYPERSQDTPCFQAEFYGCTPNRDCKRPVGIEDSNIIPDDLITSSSFFANHFAHSGRLNGKMQLAQGQWGAWCAAAWDKSPWLQIDLKQVRELSAIETQGHPSTAMSSWVTKYVFHYSQNGLNWNSYKNSTIFDGNTDGNAKIRITFKEPIVARYIRFLPKSWKIDLPCLRVEVYECVSRKASIPNLIHGLSDVITERGKSLTMSCLFHGQPNITIGWNLNTHYLRMDNRFSAHEANTESEASSTLFIKRVKGSENGAVFTCKAWYPNLQKIHAVTSGAVTVLAPIPSLAVVNVSTTHSWNYINFTGPLTSDVLGYRVKLSSVDGIVLINIPFNETALVKVSDLRPNLEYRLEVAMRYIEDEIGEYRSMKTINTPQDKPYGAPLDLQVTKSFHDTLHITWNDPAPKLRNGPITFHEIRYVKTEKNDNGVKRKIIKMGYIVKSTVNRTINLDNLEPGVIYEISVRSYTKIGPGPWVHPPTLMFTGKATEELNSLKKMVITDSNAAAVSNRLKNITADPNFLNKHDVVLTLDILEKVVDKRNSSDEIGKSLVEAVSNVLKANKTVLSESEITNRTGTRYVKMLEKWLEGVTSKDKKLEEESENVIVKKIFLNKLKIEEGIQFAKVDQDNSVEITIPKEAVPENSTADSVYFVFYKKNKFFSGKKRLEELCINGFTVIKERVYTPVVSGEVSGRRTRNLSTPVVLKFKHNEDTNQLRETACAYWDYQADNAKGAWSTEGCKLESIVNKTITCHCNHLTNFAAMMDVYAETSTICGKHQKIISFITVIGCFLSLIGLFLTFLTYFMFRKLLKEMSSKVLVQLCFALFVVTLTFVTGIEQTDKPAVCMTVAFVLHYFTLVSFFWMLMEASFMYHAFVKVFAQRASGDILRSTCVAWGIPFLIVGITFLTSMDSYGGKHYCHLTGTPLIASYLAPIGLIIFINFILFILIMHRLSTRPNSNTDQNNRNVAITRLRQAFGILILMGLTWAFGFGSITDARLVFSYLFSIFNASQGFAIFIFYCVAQERARSHWYAFFTCDSRSENKRNTDSYFSERRRMSSINSNRTATLQFRMGSNASTILPTSGSMSNGYVLSPDRYSSPPPMNTIEEVESPIMKFDDEPPEYPLIDLSNETAPERPLISPTRTQVDGIDESVEEEEEDELLNKKLQASEDSRKQPHRTSKSDIKQYSSYRALTGTKLYDVLSLVNTPSGKNLDNSTTVHRRSTEVLFRKDSQPRKSADNRRSLIDTSTLNRASKSPPRVKSMEFINDKQYLESEIPAYNVDLTAFKKMDSDATISTKNNLGHQDVTPNQDIDNKVRASSIDTGTLKSDAATMTEGVVIQPSYDARPSRQNKGDVLAWLENCEDDVKDSDSDYSSSFYKTSRSSSMTDRHNTASTSSYIDDVHVNEYHRKSAEKELLDNMILGPLKGNSNNNGSRTHRNANARHDDEEKLSDYSEKGYSASEDEIFDDKKTNRAVRKKKSRNRSTPSFSKPVGYLTLDNPSEQSSYV